MQNYYAQLDPKMDMQYVGRDWIWSIFICKASLHFPTYFIFSLIKRQWHREWQNVMLIFFFFLPFLHLENRICNIHMYRLASLHFSIYFIFFSSTDNGTENCRTLWLFSECTRFKSTGTFFLKFDRQMSI